MRRALVVVEVALALTLLTGGALLLESFVRLQAANLGFNPENVLVGVVNPPRTTYGTRPKYRAFYDQVLNHVDQVASLVSMHAGVGKLTDPTDF